MVRKSSRGVVHSGNTLRASNSRYSRRYFHQSCIISHVGQEVLKNLLGARTGSSESTVRLEPSGASSTAADDKLMRPQNVPIDVALSLNKQSRWLLPSALKQDITSSVAEPGVTVSLLERHKLKRHANCVSFCSNTGSVRKIEPRRGRYFSFAFPLSDGSSRRARKREARIAMVQKGLKTSGVKHVFTFDGPFNEKVGDSEVRYEVFYPCPAQSSISHNPKYIKQYVSSPPGDNTREHPEYSKPRRKHRCKHRKGFTLKDIDCEQNIVPLDFDSDFEDGGYSEDSYSYNFKQPADTAEVLLDILIEKADKVHQHCQKNKSRQKKKTECIEEQFTKSHIRYIDLSDAEEKASRVETPFELPTPPPTESSRVILHASDVSISVLAESFGKMYFEAACHPRKFVLDITDHMRNLMKKKGLHRTVAECNEKAVSFVVFTFDGVYDNDFDVYNVSLNSLLCPGLLAVCCASQQTLDVSTVETVISQAMDVADACLTDLNIAGVFPEGYQIRTSLLDRHVKQHLGHTESYFPSVQQVFWRGSKVTEVHRPSLEDVLNEDSTFCDVCYDDVSPLVAEATAATSLLACGHKVCDPCWARHVWSRLQQGLVRVTCPGYDCQAEVDVGVLLSVVPADVASKIIQQQEEIRIGMSPMEKWCPNERCGRVLRLNAQPYHPATSDLGEIVLQQDVTCACGSHVCFLCLSAAHWPASCQQARSYRHALVVGDIPPHKDDEVHDDAEAALREKMMREMKSDKLMLVKGKHCPRCKNFVEKDGGCNQVMCRCGLSFCFYCLQPGSTHHGGRNCITSEGEKKLTTTVAVHHISRIDSKDKDKQKMSRRSRLSLIGRAVELRGHQLKHWGSPSVVKNMAKAVVAAALKNSTMVKHVMRTCGATASGHMKTPDSSSLIPSAESALTCLSATVREFLSHVMHSSQEVLEVAEYTLVLGKDVPDSLLRRRALRIAEDLSTFSTFTKSVFDVFSQGTEATPAQDAVKAILRLGEIHRWSQASLSSLITTIRKLRAESTL